MERLDRRVGERRVHVLTDSIHVVHPITSEHAAVDPSTPCPSAHGATDRPRTAGAGAPAGTGRLEAGPAAVSRWRVGRPCPGDLRRSGHGKDLGCIRDWSCPAGSRDSTCPHDTDELDRVWPQPEPVEALIDLSRRNLSAWWAGFSELGVRHLVLCGVMASVAQSERWIAEAVVELASALFGCLPPNRTEKSVSGARDRKWLRSRDAEFGQGRSSRRCARSTGHGGESRRTPRKSAWSRERCSRWSAGTAEPTRRNPWVSSTRKCAERTSRGSRGPGRSTPPSVGPKRHPSNVGGAGSRTS